MIVFNKFNLVFLVLLIVLSGCVVQSRQLNGFLELLANSSKDHSINSWLVSYSDYESIVYAVSVPNGVLFSNSAGDQVLFDGWVIRKVRGMGRFRLNSDIDDDLNLRIFKFYRFLIFVVTHRRCGPPQAQIRFFRFSIFGAGV